MDLVYSRTMASLAWTARHELEARGIMNGIFAVIPGFERVEQEDKTEMIFNYGGYETSHVGRRAGHYRGSAKSLILLSPLQNNAYA